MPHDDQTPTRPYPVIRSHLEIPGALDGKPVDSVWFYEWRREIAAALRDLRKDHQEALKGVEVRLGGIEGRLNEGDSTIRKHEHQLTELIDEAAEVDKRLRIVEAHQFDAIVARLTALEDDRRERRASEKAESQQAKAIKASLWVRSRDAAVIAAAGAVGLAIVGLGGWLISLYARSAP
jgi:ElaB/YqjD/DUF883 family membrane-anchored ribosome-binding protein